MIYVSDFSRFPTYNSQIGGSGYGIYMACCVKDSPSCYFLTLGDTCPILSGGFPVEDPDCVSNATFRFCITAMGDYRGTQRTIKVKI